MSKKDPTPRSHRACMLACLDSGPFWSGHRSMCIANFCPPPSCRHTRRCRWWRWRELSRLPLPSWRDGRRPGPRQPCPAGRHAHTAQLLSWAAGRAKVANKVGHSDSPHWSPPQGVAGSANPEVCPAPSHIQFQSSFDTGCIPPALLGRAVQAPEGFGGRGSEGLGARFHLRDLPDA